MAGGASKKTKADCRADTRGGPWAGIPKCLIDSAAYRDLSLHARAVLVEIVARMNGYNNGSIGISQREMVDAIGCSPNRIVTAIADLMQHGLLDVTVAGAWKTRMARQYRLTFVTTKNAPATNDYLRWTPSIEKSGATGVVSDGGRSATGAIATDSATATGAIARLDDYRRKTANLPESSATGAVSLIGKPYPQPEMAESGHGNQQDNDPLKHGGDRCGIETLAGVEPRACEQCGDDFHTGRDDRAHVRRFCSEQCRKRAERARAYERRKAQA